MERGLSPKLLEMGLAEGMVAGEGPAFFSGLLGTSLRSLTGIQSESQGLWLPEVLMQRTGAWKGWGLQAPEKFWA